ATASRTAATTHHMRTIGSPHAARATPAETVRGADGGSVLVAWSVIDSRQGSRAVRSEEHTSELQSRENLVCRLLLEKKKKIDDYLMIIYRHATCGRPGAIRPIPRHGSRPGDSAPP